MGRVWRASRLFTNGQPKDASNKPFKGWKRAERKRYKTFKFELFACAFFLFVASDCFLDAAEQL